MICPTDGQQCESTGCVGGAMCIRRRQGLPPHQLGWLCPKCGRGNAPFAHTCPCGPAVTFTTYDGTGYVNGEAGTPLIASTFGDKTR